MWCLLKHKITCHSPPCTICHNSAATVARTSQESQACLKTCLWSMEPARLCHLLHHVQDKDQPEGAHEEGCSSTILDLKESRAGLIKNICFSFLFWMGSVWRDKEQERERVLTSVMSVTRLSTFCQHLPNQHKLWQHSGHVFQDQQQHQ